MRSILKFIVTLVVIGAVGSVAYSKIPQFQAFADDVIYQARSLVGAPCTRPLTYSLGTFDTRFGVSKDYFLAALRDAEVIWEKPFGRELFTYEASTGRMKVHLIYDYRQESSTKLTSLGTTVDNNKAAYDALQVRYQAIKSQYDQAKTTYDIKTKAYDERAKAYDEKVRYWNQHGGAPKQEYNALQAEKAALQSELYAIKGLEAQINEFVKQINSMVATINQLAKSLNLTVDKYNTIGATLGESFEEGLYHTDGRKKQIDIYEFKDRASLVRVLAHELGHALDLDHVEDPKAIMYAMNQSINMMATEADLAALEVVCRIGSKNN